MHTIITGCSCVIFKDLTVCHKQIEEKWGQQIIVVANRYSSCRNTVGDINVLI